MTPFTVFDTEDDTPELERSGRSPFEKRITQLAAIGCNGEEFYLKPKTVRTRIENGIKIHEQDFRPFFAFLGKQNWPRVYAHNLQYDLGIFAENLDDLDITLVGSRLIKAIHRNATFLDSFNIWPMAAKKIGAAVGLEKLKFDPNSRDYVFRDVAIIRKAMQLAYSLAAEHGLDSIPSTLGGLCVKLWHALGGGNWQCSWRMARQALYGGRVEIFCQGGTGNIFYTDINSLYPYVMTQPFPDAWERLPDFTKGWGVARIKIEIPKCEIAPLPVRREDGAIYYPYGLVDGAERETPDGYRNGIWTFHEIRNAIRHGAKVLKIYEAYGSLRAEYYYRDFVLKFYEARKAEEDEGKKTFYKLLMNNLYGQLGMRGTITRSLLLDRCVLHDSKTGEILYDEFGEPRLTKDGKPYGKKLLAEQAIPLPDHVNYLHAAYVTSYARLQLQRFLRIIPTRDLIYCDTDSLIFWNKGEKLPFSIGKELGEMKLEGRASKVIVNAPKHYAIDFKEKDGTTTTRYKVKGVPARYSEREQYLIDIGKLDPKNAKTLQQQFIEQGTVDLMMPFKLRESVVFFDRMKASKASEKTRKLSVWRRVTKSSQTEYDKKELVDGRFIPKKCLQFEKDKH